MKLTTEEFENIKFVVEVLGPRLDSLGIPFISKPLMPADMKIAADFHKFVKEIVDVIIKTMGFYHGFDIVRYDWDEMVVIVSGYDYEHDPIDEYRIPLSIILSENPKEEAVKYATSELDKLGSYYSL